jgi:hypothetical protein
MSAGQQQIACALTFKLARLHGWSSKIDVADLASKAPVQNEQKARAVARDVLPSKEFIGHHQGTDQIWLKIPPADGLKEFLTNQCQYSEIQVDATLDSYLD